MCFALAQPRENPEKTTQERTRIFRRPYMSLILEMQTANPTRLLSEEVSFHGCKCMIRTHIGQQIRQHDPRCIDKVIQVIRYRDKRRRHDRRIESRDQKTNKKPTSVRTARPQGGWNHQLRYDKCRPLQAPDLSRAPIAKL